MITTVLWDVDGTLLDFQYSQKQALKQCFASVGIELTTEVLERYSRINDMFWKKHERGEITKERLLRERFVILFEEFGFEGIDVEAFMAEFQEGLIKYYAYIDDAPAICQALLEKGIEQYVITNAVTDTAKSKLGLSGLDRFMKKLFISGQIGVPKPAKGFFDMVLAEITEKDPERILVVGDSLTSDIKGGVMAGLKTCWYRKEGMVNTSEYSPDMEIEDLHELLELWKEG